MVRACAPVAAWPRGRAHAPATVPRVPRSRTGTRAADTGWLEPRPGHGAGDGAWPGCAALCQPGLPQRLGHRAPRTRLPRAVLPAPATPAARLPLAALAPVVPGPLGGLARLVLQPHRQRDALALGVDVQHLPPHHFTGAHDVPRVADERVRHRGDVHQAVLMHADVDERAE